MGPFDVAVDNGGPWRVSVSIDYDKYSEVHKQLCHSYGLYFCKALGAPYCFLVCFLLKVCP